VVTYARTSNGELVNQFALDIIAAGGLSKAYLENLVHMRYCDVLTPALLEIYESYVPVNERQKLSLTVADLTGEVFSWVPAPVVG